MDTVDIRETYSLGCMDRRRDLCRQRCVKYVDCGAFFGGRRLKTYNMTANWLSRIYIWLWYSFDVAAYKVCEDNLLLCLQWKSWCVCSPCFREDLRDLFRSHRLM